MKNFNSPNAWYPTAKDREIAAKFDVKAEIEKAYKQREIRNTVEVMKELMGEWRNER